MQKNYEKYSTNTGFMFIIGIVLMGVILFVPDASQLEHQSFFGFAHRGIWGLYFEWPRAWCSVKIILLSLAILLIVDATANLLIRFHYDLLGLVLLTSTIFPGLLALLGLYELAKAIF